MSINVSELIWTIVCFFVLLFVLKKLLFDPLVRFMDARNAKVADGFEAGRAARAAREENDAALLAKRKERNAEAASIVAAAHAKDEQERAAALANAQKSAAASMKDVRAALRDEEKAAEAALDAEVPAFVQTLAAALTGAQSE